MTAQGAAAPLAGGLVGWAAAQARSRAGRPAQVSVLRASPSVVVAAGRVVVKIHEEGTDPRALARRLEAAQVLAARGLLLAPLAEVPLAVPGAEPERWATVWPRVEPLAGTPDDVPWAAAGALLATLHDERPVAGQLSGLPAHGAPGRFRRDVAGMEAALAGLAPADGAASGTAPPEVTELLVAAKVVRAAAASLPEWAHEAAPPGRPLTVVHGDFHLGQVARAAGSGCRWLLIDVDDLGVGDPVWDLARPAAFWACGLLAEEHWSLFLAGYRAARAALEPGGDAFGLGRGPADDPWPLLDRVARPCVVQTAAAGVRRAVGRVSQAAGAVAGPGPEEQPLGLAPAGLDEVDRHLLAACRRMTGDR